MITEIESCPKIEQGSELVIPAVPGEFYAYSAVFTDERSLYALMKCKANKARPRANAATLGHEANLLFEFEGGRVQVCGMKTAQGRGLVDGSFDTTRIALVVPAVGLTTEEFYRIQSSKDVVALVSKIQVALKKGETMSAILHKGDIVAVETSAGKYGLFLVKELAAASVEIDACHILL